MSLPLEPTPELDEEGTIWLFQRMKYWETHKRPPRDLEIDMDAVNAAVAETKARREARLKREAEENAQKEEK